MLSRFGRAVRLANPGCIAIADAKQNGGSYDFIIEKKGEGQDYTNFGWPTEQRFWDDLMYNSSQWGLFMYEQDWLDTEYDNMKYLNFNATAARTWLLQMGTAAARNDLTVQYCMSHCRHIMQSIEIPAGIPTPLTPLFLGRFSPVLRRFSAVLLCCPASWRRDGENGQKMAENGRNLGEKRARNSGG